MAGPHCRAGHLLCSGGPVGQSAHLAGYPRPDLLGQVVADAGQDNQPRSADRGRRVAACGRPEQRVGPTMQDERRLGQPGQSAPAPPGSRLPALGGDVAHTAAAVALDALACRLLIEWIAGRRQGAGERQAERDVTAAARGKPLPRQPCQGAEADVAGNRERTRVAWLRCHGGEGEDPVRVP
jgi:hypothetical protein